MTLLTPEEMGNSLEQVDMDELRKFPCSSGTLINTVDVEPVARAQLAKVIGEIEAISIFENDLGEFDRKITGWLESVRKEIG